MEHSHSSDSARIESQAASSAELDEAGWLAICKRAAIDAQKRCGLSYGYLGEIFSVAIDAEVEQLPESQRARALEIATADWDYLSPEARIEAQRWNGENGYCTHGITLGCCPMGCGS